MQIIEYDPKYRQDFIDFNSAWIIEYFGFLEEEDIETFENIEEEIAAGSMIFFAVEDGTALAACMTKPMENGTWEICKLGRNQQIQRRGSGQAVLSASMKWAEDHGAKRLFIITNKRLEAAIHIYEKNGFKEIKLDDYKYERGDIAFEKIIL